MRAKWFLSAVALVGAAVVYLWVMDGGSAEEASQDTTALSKSTSRPQGAGGGLQGLSDVPARAPGEVQETVDQEEELLARKILGDIKKAHAKRDRAAYERAVDRLLADAPEAPSARRFAVKLGWAQLNDAKRHRGAERMTRLDQARRYLSRGVWLPEYFDAKNQPTKSRSQLVHAIQEANRDVMTYGRRSEHGGLQGVTKPYVVPAGEAPLTTVSRRQLPYGPNAILFWNKGTLDPRRVRAGETLLVPLEALHVEVSLERRRLAVFLGDWFVKDWGVGIGRDDKPTPHGAFEVGRNRSKNPDWWSPDGFIPFGDPRNELGSMWIAIGSDRVPEDAGIGIHGTNKPHTVGTRCSNGCVRLANENALELYGWVRGKDSNGGEPTKIEILPEA